MAYFKINDIDYSMYVNSLKIDESVTYNAQTNAAGDTVADYVNRKRNIEVGIIPLNAATMASLLAAIDAFNVNITFLNPKTNALEEASCIIPSESAEYYTIQADNVRLKALQLKFIEL